MDPRALGGRPRARNGGARRAQPRTRRQTGRRGGRHRGIIVLIDGWCINRRRRRLPLEAVSLVLRQLLQQQLEEAVFSAQHQQQQQQQHRPQQQQQLGEAVFSVRHLQPRQLRPHLPRHPLALVRLNLRRQHQPLEEVDSLVRPNQRRQQQKRPNPLQQVVVFLGLQQRRHLLQLLQRRQRQQRQQRQKQHLPPWRLRR